MFIWAFKIHPLNDTCSTQSISFFVIENDDKANVVFVSGMLQLLEIKKGTWFHYLFQGLVNKIVHFICMTLTFQKISFKAVNIDTANDH